MHAHGMAQPLDKALALRGGVSLEQASLLGALYYGFFGVGLLASPSFFFGPDGLIPYFKEEAGPGGIFFVSRATACQKPPPCV